MAKVKTAVIRSSAPLSGKIKLTNQRTSGDGQEPGPTWSVAAGAGNAMCWVSRLWWDYNSSEWSYYLPYQDPPAQGFIPAASGPDLQEGDIAFAYGIADTSLTPGPSNVWPQYQVIILPSGTDTLELEYSLSFGCQRLYRERTVAISTGRDSAPVYAVETHVADTWQDTAHPWSYTMAFGGITFTGAQQWIQLPGETEYSWYPFLSAPEGMQFFFSQRDGVSGKGYAKITAEADRASLNFTGRSRTYNGFKIKGSGNALDLSCITSGQTATVCVWSVVAGQPTIVDFSGIAAKNRSEEAEGSLQVAGGFKADLKVPATMGFPTEP